MSEEREMNLEEWCARLSEFHLVNKQLRTLKKQLRQQIGSELLEAMNCLDTAKSQIDYESYNDAMSSINEAQFRISEVCQLEEDNES